MTPNLSSKLNNVIGYITMASNWLLLAAFSLFQVFQCQALSNVTHWIKARQFTSSPSRAFFTVCHHCGKKHDFNVRNLFVQVDSMGRTVGRAPSWPPFDFHSTIYLRCGLIYWTLNEARDYPQWSYSNAKVCGGWGDGEKLPSALFASSLQLQRSNPPDIRSHASGRCWHAGYYPAVICRRKHPQITAGESRRLSVRAEAATACLLS
jgi:hypothetical protein